MNIARPIPASLKVVAAIFILSGVCSLLEVAISLLNGRISFNFGVLGVFIGIGMLRLTPIWRTWALIFVWIELIVAPIGGFLFLTATTPLTYQLFGITFGQASKVAGIIAALVVFLLALWQYRVLTRRDVRSLFGV